MTGNSLTRSTISTCLSNQQVEELLNGCVAADDMVVMSRHLESCIDCQQRLEARTSHENCDDISDDQRSVWAELCPGSQAADRSPLQRRLMEGGLIGGMSEFPTDPAIESPTQSEQPPSGTSAPFPAIEGYEFKRLIGTGGMGTVFQAYQKSLKRDVAVKLLKSRHSANARERFQREVAAVGRLQDENIVRAYDAGEANGQMYLVMELVDGSDLWRQVKAGSKLSVQLACGIIRQAAEGLAAAHDAGLVHRDVKPGNLMMTESGIVKVLDLGLVTADQSEPANGRLTEELTLMGSMDFIAPEQGCDVASADQRSDIYSLGCTLFTLLVGRPPFSGPDYRTAAQKLVAHAQADRPDVRQDRAGISEDLAVLVERMMSINPADRPQSMREVVATLAGMGNDDNSKKRTTALAAAGAFGLFVLLSVIVIKFKDGTSITINTDKPVESIDLKEAGEVISMTVDGVEQHEPAVDERSFAGLEATLRLRGTKTACFGASSADVYIVAEGGRIIHWRPLQPNQPLVDVYQAPNKTTRISKALSLLPSENSLLFANHDGLSRLNLKSGETEWTVAGSRNLSVTYVPQKDLIIHGRQTEIVVRRADSGNEVCTLPKATPQSISSLGPIGRMVTFVHRMTREVYSFDLEAENIVESLKTYTAEKFRANESAISPDGKHVIAVGDGFTMVWSIESGGIVHRHQTRYQMPQDCIRRVGNSDWYVTIRGRLRNSLVIWNPITGKVREERDIPSTLSLAISNDGKWALTTDFESDRLDIGNNVRLWKLDR